MILANGVRVPGAFEHDAIAPSSLSSSGDEPVDILCDRLRAQEKSSASPRNERQTHRRRPDDVKGWARHGGGAVFAETPPGWTMYVVTAPTNSDGDGPRADGRSCARLTRVWVRDTAPVASGRLRWIRFGRGRGTTLYRNGCHDVLFTIGRRSPVPIAGVVARCCIFLTGSTCDRSQQPRMNKSFLGRGIAVKWTRRALIVSVGGLGGAAARRLSALGACAQASGGERRSDRRLFSIVSLGADRSPGRRRGVPAPDNQTASLLTPAAGPTVNAIIVNGCGAMTDERPPGNLDGRLRAAALDVFREEPLALPVHSGRFGRSF